MPESLVNTFNLTFSFSYLRVCWYFWFCFGLRSDAIIDKTQLVKFNKFIFLKYSSSYYII